MVMKSEEINQNQNLYPHQERCITYGQMNLINDFRALWTELIIWMRSYMVSTATGFSDLEAIKNKLFTFPGEFAQKFQPFFGVELSERFQHLLLMYIVQAMAIVDAQKINDQQALDMVVRNLYRYSDELADFLARINPYWSRSLWQELLYNLNSRGISEIIALFTQDYVKEIDIRSRLLKHALTLGDYMAAGVMHYLVPENTQL